MGKKNDASSCVMVEHGCPFILRLKSNSFSVQRPHFRSSPFGESPLVGAFTKESGYRFEKLVAWVEPTDVEPDSDFLFQQRLVFRRVLICGAFPTLDCEQFAFQSTYRTGTFKLSESFSDGEEQGGGNEEKSDN
ncbi:MAG: hypothetical protein UX89_C0010G0025 [Parcubacteria group bacterium GW2011_GWA2_47_16]|nr:MAG: hypothetical protein UX89_C0010G0025 [Parcubacteria group bacterium GW2011_GWA2_47_16]